MARKSKEISEMGQISFVVETAEEVVTLETNVSTHEDPLTDTTEDAWLLHSSANVPSAEYIAAIKEMMEDTTREETRHRLDTAESSHPATAK